jgi:DNA-binding MarR family transcriptional regulator
MTGTAKPLSDRIQRLADFRHHLRLFLLFSENAAARFNLQPQQHQLLLQIAGVRDGAQATVGYATARLGLRHNTVVELSKRSEKSGLISREQDADDRRKVILKLTSKGKRILAALSEDHARELNVLAPQLIEALSALNPISKKRTRSGGRREG